MGCCDSTIKYLLFGFNLIFALSGLAVIIVGAVILSYSSDFDEVLSDIGDGLTAPQITLIAVGCIIFFVAFLGCCGAIKESRCMLITFAVFLLSIFIIELVIGIYAVTNFTNVEGKINQAIGKAFENKDPDSILLFNDLERALDCCGTTGPRSYIGVHPLSDSCCIDETVGCSKTLDITQLWREGCKEAMIDFLKSSGKILGGVGIALSFIEILGAIFALRLASNIRHQ